MRNFDYRRRYRLLSAKHADAIRSAMFTEMVGLRRQLVLRLRRLQANKPRAVTKARLYKQSVISDSLWQSFLARLKSRLIPLLRAGAIDLVELDRLYRERQPVAAHGIPENQNGIIQDGQSCSKRHRRRVVKEGLLFDL